MTEIIKIFSCDEFSTKEIKVGDQIKLNLEENPSAGYGWEIVFIEEKLLRQVGEEEFTPQSSNLGAKGKVEFTFEAVNIGTTKVELRYCRNWQKSENDKVFSISLNISS